MEVLVVEVGEPGLPRAPRGRGRSGGGSADTSAKPGSQYWIVGHGGWQLHLRKSGGNPPKRPKISRRLRRILTPRSSTPSFRTKIHQVIEFFNTPAEAEADARDGSRRRAEVARDSLHRVRGVRYRRTELARRRRSAARAKTLASATELEKVRLRGSRLLGHRARSARLR